MTHFEQKCRDSKGAYTFRKADGGSSVGFEGGGDEYLRTRKLEQTATG